MRQEVEEGEGKTFGGDKGQQRGKSLHDGGNHRNA